MKSAELQAQKTHCPHGHAYEGDNLITMIVRDREGNDTGRRKRQCRACKRASHKPASGKHRKPTAQAAE